MKKFDFRKIFVYIYAFYIIYSPNILARYLDSSIVLFLIAFLQLGMYILSGKKIIKLLTKYGLIFCISIFLISIYFALVAIYNGISITDIEGLRIVQNNMPIVYMINISFLINYLKKLKYTKLDMFNFIFNICLIQGIICILMFLISDFRQIALDLYYFNRNENYWITSSRIYGITNDYTYGTPIFHGLICSVITILALCKSKKYLLYLPFIIFAILINGRTGLLIYAICLVLIFIVYLIKTGKVLKVFSYLFLFVGLIIVLLSILKVSAPSTYQFIINFFNDTKSLFVDDKLSGNYQYLFDNMLFFPKGLKLIFGSGFKVYAGGGSEFGVYEHSDIGYVNDLFLGGIVLASTLYLTYYKFICKNKENTKEFRLINKLISISIIVLILIANYKGEVFRSSVVISGILYLKQIFYKNMDGELNE